MVEFQKEISKLGLPADDLSTVNGDLNAAIKEAKKEEPDTSKVKSRFEGAIEAIKEVLRIKYSIGGYLRKYCHTQIYLYNEIA